MPDERPANPSFGLLLTGRMTPASDCFLCRNLCMAFQGLLGLALILSPGRVKRNPYNPNPWSRRFLRILGITTGSTLLFYDCLEYSRYYLPFDPWVDDAMNARRKARSQGRVSSVWYGPNDTKYCSMEEFNERLDRFAGHQRSIRLNDVDNLKLAAMLVNLHEKNLRTAEKLTEQIDNHTFSPSPSLASLLRVVPEHVNAEAYVNAHDFHHHVQRIEHLLPLQIILFSSSGLEVAPEESSSNDADPAKDASLGQQTDKTLTSTSVS